MLLLRQLIVIINDRQADTSTNLIGSKEILRDHLVDGIYRAIEKPINVYVLYELKYFVGNLTTTVYTEDLWAFKRKSNV